MFDHLGSVKSVFKRSSLLVFPATELKPDEGTPDLPSGRVRVRLETDGSLHDVTEFEVEKVTAFLSVLFFSFTYKD